MLNLSQAATNCKNRRYIYRSFIINYKFFAEATNLVGRMVVRQRISERKVSIGTIV